MHWQNALHVAMREGEKSYEEEEVEVHYSTSSCATSGG
jgi:hypothetical protein